MDSFLSKPIDSKKLAEVLAKWDDLSRTPKTLGVLPDPSAILEAGAQTVTRASKFGSLAAAGTDMP